MITWNNIQADVLELLAVENPAVSKFDIDKAIAGKIRAEIGALQFGTDAKAKAKLTVNADFTASYNNKQKASANAEWRPFAALLRWNDSLVRSRAEFPGSTVASLPTTVEFRTLVAWIKSLRPRAEVAKEVAKAEVPAKKERDAAGNIEGAEVGIVEAAHGSE